MSQVSTMFAALWLCAYGVLPAQTFTTIHSFYGTDGKLPFAALSRETDGNLYGTTYFGGASSSGNVFKVDPVLFKKLDLSESTSVSHQGLVHRREYCEVLRWTMARPERRVVLAGVRPARVSAE